MMIAGAAGCVKTPQNDVNNGGSELTSSYGGSTDAKLPPELDSISGTESDLSSEPPVVTEEFPSTDAKEAPPLAVTDKDAVKSELRAAITELRQPAVMDISNAGFSERTDLDVKNLYYEIVKESPELKYAYDISVETDGGKLVCGFRYMPYKTGEFPDGFTGGDAGSLEDIIEAAEHNAGEKPYDIAIRNPDLEPDVINRALQQAGGGYINCTLNSDATQIVFSAPPGMTIADCQDALGEAERLADDVISRLIEEDMTDREKAASLYLYLTETVRYDRLYYSDREKMPYQSHTALGALKDGTAICGGYSHAVKLLFEKVGIPCFHVSGKYNGEPHMWNMAQIDGEWLWFDATADRGFKTETKLRHFALKELSADQYSWNSSYLWFIE